MDSLAERESRLRMLISRLDSEAGKFESILRRVEEKQLALAESVSRRGLKRVPVSILPHSGGELSLYEEIKSHLDELKRMRAEAAAQLDMVQREQSLAEGLKKDYGEKVEIKRGQAGSFEIDFRDDETDAAFEQLKGSRKLALQVRDALNEAGG